MASESFVVDLSLSFISGQPGLGLSGMEWCFLFLYAISAYRRVTRLKRRRAGRY
jgi:hypothetical protein